MGWRKKLGLAGLAGVAATGVLIARAERRRRAYTPQQVRQQLHSRIAQGQEAATAPALPNSVERASRPERLRAWLHTRAPSRWRG